jgi:hypothetical protein
MLSLSKQRVASPSSVVDLHLLHHAAFDRRFLNVPDPNPLLDRFLLFLEARRKIATRKVPFPTL